MDNWGGTLWQCIMMMFLVTALSGCCALCHRQCQKKAQLADMVPDSASAVITDIVYDSEKKLAYDLFLPVSKPVGEPIGAMLFIHGGGWAGGNKEGFRSFCEKYVKKGYVTATLDYTLYSYDKEKKTSFADMLDDIEHCLEHIRVTSAAAGYPIGSIALSGYSAGGHLAMLYAYSRTSTWPIPVSFVFSMVGPSFFANEAWPEGSVINKCLQLMAEGRRSECNGIDIILDSIDANLQNIEDKKNSCEVMKALNEISPAMHVNEHSVPSVLAYGVIDSLVPQPHSKKMEEVLTKYDVPHVLINFPHSDHSLSQDKDCMEQFDNAVDEYCQKYMKY